MQIKTHEIGQARIAEVIAEDVLIGSSEDGLNLLGNLYFQNLDKIVLHEKNISADFFDLSNGMAGEILQKFSNYRVRLALLGDFSKYPSNSLRDFIKESNRSGSVNFVSNLEEALSCLAKHRYQ